MEALGSLKEFIDIVVLAVFWIVIQPLKTTMSDLKDSINTLCEEIIVLRKQAADNRVEIAKLTESCKDAHHRLNELSNRVTNVEQKCQHCTCRPTGR